MASHLARKHIPQGHADPLPILDLMKIATKASMATCFGGEVYGQPSRTNATVGATQRNVQVANRCKKVCGIVIAPCHS